MLARRTARLATAVAGVLLAVAACDGGARPSARPTPGAQPSAQREKPPTTDEPVTLLPRHLPQAPDRLGAMPAAFPPSLTGLPEVTFGSAASGYAASSRAEIAYRPREALSDGSGWSSETVALWSGADGWARLRLARLGLPDDLWPGADMLGPGALNADGSKLAFHAARGVIVLDVATGDWRHLLADAGWLGTVRWHPDGRRLIVDPRTGGRDDLVVDVRSGVAEVAPVPAFTVGFRDTGETVSVVRVGGRDVVATLGARGAVHERVEIPASPLMAGRRFASWVHGARVAYRSYEALRGRQALRVADLSTGEPVATLTWSRRTGTLLGVHGWWDASRVLLSIDRSLATWTPETGELVRVATLPRSDIGGAHAAVGIGFRSP